MKRVLLLALLLLSACSSSGDVVFGDCPITSPLGGVPDVVDFESPVPWVREESGWYGNEALWVSLPPDGVLPSLPSAEDPELLDTKFPWWRITAGELTVETAQVDGDEAIVGSVPSGYGDSGFTPSGLMFSSEGCWQVTGAVSGEELSFVVWVCETETFPAVVSPEERETCGAT